MLTFTIESWVWYALTWLVVVARLYVLHTHLCGPDMDTYKSQRVSEGVAWVLQEVAD